MSSAISAMKRLGIAGTSSRPFLRFLLHDTTSERCARRADQPHRRGPVRATHDREEGRADRHNLLARAQQTEEVRREEHKADAEHEPGDRAEHQRLPRRVGRLGRAPLPHPPADDRDRSDGERPPYREHQEQEVPGGSGAGGRGRAEMPDQ